MGEAGGGLYYPDSEEEEPERCPECHMPLTMHHDPACSQPCGACAAAPRRYSFTRDQLIDVLTRLEVYPVGAPLARPSVVVAFAMLADSIIEALETERRREWRASLRGGSDG